MHMPCMWLDMFPWTNHWLCKWLYIIYVAPKTVNERALLHYKSFLNVQVIGDDEFRLRIGSKIFYQHVTYLHVISSISHRTSSGNSMPLQPLQRTKNFALRFAPSWEKGKQLSSKRNQKLVINIINTIFKAVARIVTSILGWLHCSTVFWLFSDLISQ